MSIEFRTHPLSSLTNGFAVFQFPVRFICCLLLAVLSMPGLLEASQERASVHSDETTQLPVLDNVPTTCCFWDTGKQVCFSHYRCVSIALGETSLEWMDDQRAIVFAASLLKRSLGDLSLLALGSRLDI